MRTEWCSLNSVPRRRHQPRSPSNGLVSTALPADVTSLVGREPEEAAAIHLLRSPPTRLLTLVGPGGVGKTRLAIRIARTMGPEFEHGVGFVPLAATTDSDEAVWSIARGLGVAGSSPNPRATLCDGIGDQELLLVLDNLEQLDPIDIGIPELLSSCPNLSILVTSRSPLHVRGEQLLDVPPLEFPADDVRLGSEAAQGYTAVALFVQRARALRPEFHLEDRQVEQVVEICRRLDGLPLAIELAAGQIRHMSAASLLDRLKDRTNTGFVGPLDSPERQRTMAAAISWSYALLDSDEQAMFRAASVFVGGWTLPALEEIADRSHRDVGALLDSLTSKSLLLVRSTEAGERRFAMLETVREYSLEMATVTGEAGRLRYRHAEYFQTVVSHAYKEQLERGPSEYAPRLEPEHENILAALRWLTDQGDIVSALGLAAGMFEFWVCWGYVREGREWLERLIALADPAAGESTIEVPPTAYVGAARMAWIQNDPERASTLYERALIGYEQDGDGRGASVVLNNLGAVAHLQNDYERAAAFYRRAVDRGRMVGNTYATALPLGNLGTVAMQQGDFESATALFDDAIGMYRSLGYDQKLAIVLGNRGSLAYRQGLYDEAAAIHQEALDMKRANGDRMSSAYSLGDLAWTEIERGNIDRAHDLLTEALDIFSQAGQRDAVAEALEAMARIAYERGRLERAARLYAGAEALRKEVGVTHHPADLARYQQAIESLREALGPSAFAAAWRVGQLMSVDNLLEQPEPQRL